MKLTLPNRLKLCWEILTIRSGYDHTAQEKQLSTFQRGYLAGRLDSRLEREEDVETVRRECADIAEKCAYEYSGEQLRQSIRRAILKK